MKLEDEEGLKEVEDGHFGAGKSLGTLDRLKSSYWYDVVRFGQARANLFLGISKRSHTNGGFYNLIKFIILPYYFNAGYGLTSQQVVLLLGKMIFFFGWLCHA